MVSGSDVGLPCIVYPGGHVTWQAEFTGTGPVAQENGLTITPAWTIWSLGQTFSESNKYWAVWRIEL